MAKQWYRGKWRVSKEIASLVMDVLNQLTQRGLEIKHEGEYWEFWSYHPADTWFQEQKEIETRIALLSTLFSDASIECEWESFLEENWQNNWREYFKPQRISPQLIVLPAWEQYHPQVGEIAIWIEPGMAFGTGTHETTQLCLKTMLEFFPKELPQSLLDVGTGTGILAILGAKLGIREIMAVDTDPLAVEAARENIRLNQIRDIKLKEGSISEVQENYDWVVANLETKIILPIIKDLKNCARKTLILSGILAEEATLIQEAMDSPCRYTRYQGEWVCLVF